MKRLTIGVLAIYLASILLTGCTIGDTEYVLDDTGVAVRIPYAPYEG